MIIIRRRMCNEMDFTLFFVDIFVAHRCDPPKCGQCCCILSLEI